MIKCIQYRRAIVALNMHTQVGGRLIYQVTPPLTNMRELGPPKADIPKILIIQSIAVEYVEKYIIVEPKDSHVWDVRC